jgi:hypothetical protein
MSSVAEVISQLRDLIERLDQTAMAASRAQAEAAQSHRLFAEVAQGSEHPKIREAVTRESNGW